MLETGEEIDETQHQPKFYCNRCKRSEKLLQERLAWYTESLHYDCTLRVGRENPKMFKCHKIVLASSSEAFASMLYTDLVEGGKGKDDPITVDDESITPESFDLAMRYIYGDAENFQTVSIACEIYKFARKYMIEDLMHAAANKIKAAAPHEILQVYETLKFLDKSDKLKDALKTIIVRNTNEVLSSPQWIEAAPSTVLDIFKEPVLKVGSEKHLYEALITWGEKNSETTSNLRPMIDSALKQIRFMTFSPLEFSKLCLMNANILTTEEQNQIFMSISLNDPTQLPSDFSVCESDRKKKKFFYFGFGSPYHFVTDAEVNFKSLRSRIVFSIKALHEPKLLVFITGVDLACLIHEENKGLAADLICILKKYKSGGQVAKALFKGTIGLESEGVIFAEPVLLDQSSWYEISVQYLNTHSLRTEKYQYKNPSTWWFQNYEGEELEHKHRDQVTHVDICKMQYFTI